MNKFGWFSLVMFLGGILTFAVMIILDEALPFAIAILGVFSILGIIFAILSKKWVAGIFGCLSNGAMLFLTGVSVLVYMLSH